MRRYRLMSLTVMNRRLLSALFRFCASNFSPANHASCRLSSLEQAIDSNSVSFVIDSKSSRLSSCKPRILAVASSVERSRQHHLRQVCERDNEDCSTVAIVVHSAMAHVSDLQVYETFVQVQTSRMSLFDVHGYRCV